MQRPYRDSTASAGISARPSAPSTPSGRRACVRRRPATRPAQRWTRRTRPGRQPGCDRRGGATLSRPPSAPADFAGRGRRHAAARTAGPRRAPLGRGQQPAWAARRRVVAPRRRAGRADAGRDAKQVAAPGRRERSHASAPPRLRRAHGRHCCGSTARGRTPDVHRRRRSARSPIDLVGLGLAGHARAPAARPRRRPLLVSLVEPAVTLTARIEGPARRGLPGWLPPDWFDDLLLNPVMAAPVFTRPMYQALDAYSRDWLLPGLATLPQPDLVTVLRQQRASSSRRSWPGCRTRWAASCCGAAIRPTSAARTSAGSGTPASDDLAQDLARFTPTALGLAPGCRLGRAGRAAGPRRADPPLPRRDACSPCTPAGRTPNGVPDLRGRAESRSTRWCWPRSCSTATSTRTSRWSAST